MYLRYACSSRTYVVLYGRHKGDHKGYLVYGRMILIVSGAARDWKWNHQAPCLSVLHAKKSMRRYMHRCYIHYMTLRYIIMYLTLPITFLRLHVVAEQTNGSTFPLHPLHQVQGEEVAEGEVYHAPSFLQDPLNGRWYTGAVYPSLSKPWRPTGLVSWLMFGWC